MCHICSKYERRKAMACKQYGYDEGCIVPGCTNRAMLHHMVPRRAGGSDAITNLISICPLHEHRIHKAGHLARVQNDFPEVDIIAISKMPRPVRKSFLRRLRSSSNVPSHNP